MLLGLSSMIGWGTQQSKGGLDQSNCSFTFKDAHSLAPARAVSGTSQSMETMEQTQDLLERLYLTAGWGTCGDPPDSLEFDSGDIEAGEYFLSLFP